jgi:hypothetical protein
VKLEKQDLRVPLLVSPVEPLLLQAVAAVAAEAALLVQGDLAAELHLYQRLKMEDQQHNLV